MKEHNNGITSIVLTSFLAGSVLKVLIAWLSCILYSFLLSLFFTQPYIKLISLLYRDKFICQFKYLLSIYHVFLGMLVFYMFYNCFFSFPSCIFFLQLLNLVHNIAEYKVYFYVVVKMSNLSLPIDDLINLVYW